MFSKQAIIAIALCSSLGKVLAQQPSQVELKIESANRTLTVNAEERVTAEPEIAILHIGFETPPSDAKSAYAAGAKASNEIVAALKQAGIAAASIRSESQRLESYDRKSHKFKLVQHWAVKAPPDRAAEILDIAIGAGATDSGDIDWTVENVQALEEQAIDRAAARARADAMVLAKGMDVHLGKLIYVTNEISTPQGARNFATANFSGSYEDKSRSTSSPLAIEPRKVSRTANVYAVFAIE